MNKIRLVGVILIISMLVGYFVFEQSRKTTYQDIVAELIGEVETVEQITVSTQLPFLKKTATVIMDDQEIINNILNQDIKLKKTLGEKPKVYEHALLIQTNQGLYALGFDLGKITVGSTEYQTIDPVVNPVYMLFVTEDLKWEIGPYNPVLSEE